MKKIIFVHLLNDFSGSPKVLSQIIAACKKKQFDLTLYTGNSDIGFLSNSLRDHHIYKYKWHHNKYWTLWTFLSSQFRLFFKLLKYRKEDIIIYVNTMLPFGAALAGYLMRKPIYYHIHEISLKPKGLKQFLRAVIQLTATKVIFVSKAVKISESFRNKEEYIVLNALPSNFKDVASKHNFQYKTKGIFNVLMIASLKTYKGVNEFMEIAQRLQSNDSIKMTLVLNATDEEISSYFRSLEVPSNVALISKQSDLILFYKKASILMNLSRVDQCVETFGLTILEAMSFGIPVIVPPIGGPTELVNNGVEGYLISSYETDKIANTILQLYKDKAKCLELSANSRKRSMAFDETDFSKKILKILNG